MRDLIASLWDVKSVEKPTVWYEIGPSNNFIVDMIRTRVTHEFKINNGCLVNVIYYSTRIYVWEYDLINSKSTELIKWDYIEKMDECEYFQYSTVVDTLGLDYNDYRCMLTQFDRFMNMRGVSDD